VSEPTHEELRATLQLAQMILTDHEPGIDPTIERLARALVRFGEATAHYENAITWDTTCQRCARLLDSCFAADHRADRAESALAVAIAMSKAQRENEITERTDLATRLREAELAREQAQPPRGVLTLLRLPDNATAQDAVDALMGVVAEAGLWRAFMEQGRTPPEPIPPGTTIADLLRLPEEP
jgi:hypothetical protein